MSDEENRQIVVDAYAAFGRGDIEAVIDSLAEDVVWTNHSFPASPTSGVFHGQDGVWDFFTVVADTSTSTSLTCARSSLKVTS
jgi:ketosteroid isomerase-like protein